jgi:hypothetical protein
MSDENTYGFNKDDAQSLLQSISHGEVLFPEIRPRGGVNASASAGSCPCECIEQGDAIVNGIETTLRWTVKMTKNEVFNQEFGSITFPSGDYLLTLDTETDIWSLDIGDFLTAAYTSGADATEDTTMDGELTMGFDAYGVPYVSLCVDGEVPEEA